MAEQKPVGAIKLGVSLDGTSFGNDLDTINTKIKQAESSMKANMKAFQGASKTYDGLGQKVKDLTTVMNGQDAKIQELNKRRDQAIKKYGEESKQVIKLNTQINNATAKYNGYAKQLNDTKKELAYASTGVNTLTKEMRENEKATNDEVKALKQAGDEAGALEAQQKGLEKQLALTEQATREQEKVVAQLSEEFGVSAKETLDAVASLEKLERQTKITSTQLDGVKKSGQNLDLSNEVGKTEKGIDGADVALGTFIGSLGANIAAKGLEAVANLASEVAEEFGAAKESYEQFLLATRGNKGQTGKLSEASNNAYTEMGGDREEFNQASEIVLSFTPQIDQSELENQSKMAVAYAKATGSDVSESIAGAYKLAGEFGIPVEEAYNAMQTMAKNVGDQKHEIADQMNEYARFYAQNGDSVQSMADKIVNGYRSGAYQVDKFNDLYKEMGLTIQDTGKMADVVDDLGLWDVYGQYKDGSITVTQMNNAVLQSIQQIEDPQKRLMKYQEVYGTLAEDNGLKVLDSLGKQGEGAKITAGEMDKLIALSEDNSPWEALKRNTANLFSPMSDSMVTFNSKMKDFIDEMFKPRKIQWFEDLKGFLEPYLIPMIDKVKKIFSDMFKSFSDYWNTDGKQFIEAFKNFLEFIKPLLNIVVGIIHQFIDSVGNLVNGIVQSIQGLMKIFTGIFTGDFKMLWDGLKQLFFGSIEAIWGYLNMMFFGRIVKGVGGFVKAIPKSISGMWTSIKAFFTQGISNVGCSVGGFVASIPKKLFTMGSNSKNAITNMWNGIKGNFISGIANVGTNVSRFVASIPQRLFSMASSGKNAITSMWKGIKNSFSNGVSNIVTKMKNLPGTIAEGIVNNTYKVVNAFKSMFKKAQQIIKKPVNTVIGGANWVLEKFGAKKLPTWQPDEKYAKGTPRGGHKGGNALVNDGNGAEMVVMPNGQAFIPKGKNVLIPNAPKGMHVLNAEDTANAMGKNSPTFAYKKGTNWFSEIGKWAKEKVSDIWDFVSNPSKLVDVALGKFLDFGDASHFALDAGKGLVTKAKDSMVGWTKKLFAKNESNLGDNGFYGDVSKNGNGVYQYLMNIANGFLKKYKDQGLYLSSGLRFTDNFDHSKGLAVDLAIPGVNNGSPIYRKIADEAIKMDGIKYVITNGMWRWKNQGWKPWADGDHYDHVHLSGEKPIGQKYKVTSQGFGVDRWRNLATQALQMEGVYSTANLNAMMNQIRTESSGNPNTINNWDINAKNGTPSKGLLQVIDPTFQFYKRPGFNNIWAPLDNMLASIRYVKARYESITNGYRGVGYENGGFITKQHLAMVGEGNKPEVVIPLSSAKRSRAMELLEKTKTILGDTDNVIIKSNDNGSDLSKLESKFDKLISLVQGLLEKDSNVYMDGRQVSKQLEKRNNRDKISKARGRGQVVFA